MGQGTLPPLPMGYQPYQPDEEIPPLPSGYKSTEPVKKKVGWKDLVYGGNDGSFAGLLGGSVKQKPVEKTQQEKLKNLGIDVTFEKEEPKSLIAAPTGKFTDPIGQPFNSKPLYIDINNPESLSYLSSKIKEAKEKADRYTVDDGTIKSLGLNYKKQFA